MRNSIFETESYRGTGIRTISAAAVTTLILSATSAMAVVFIMANFGEITAAIAIHVAGLLTSWFPIMVAAVLGIWFLLRLQWNIRRIFRGW